MELNTQQQDVHLLHYWNVIRKRWKVAAAILAVVMIGTFLASYFSKPLYRSQVRIQIERESNSVTIEDIFGIAASEQEFLLTQNVLLQSRGLALRVVEENKLYNDPELYPAGVAGRTPEELKPISEGIADILNGGISIEPVRGTSLVDIYYVGASPRLAQKVAEAWAEAFIRMNIAKKLDAVQQASEFLNRQIATIQADLETSRKELQAYGRSRGIISMGSDSGSDDVVMSKLGQLNRDLTNAQQVVFQKEASLGALQRTAADAVASGDPMVQRLSEELGHMQRDYSDKLTTLKEGHPEMKRLASQIEKTRAARNLAVSQAYGKQVEAARAEYTAAVAQENSIRTAYDQQRGEAQRLNVDSARYLDLRMAVETKQGLLATLQKQLSETEVAARLRGSATSNIHIIDHARTPGGRFNLSMKKNLQNAFPLGTILGFAAIFFLEYMDRSVKTPEELERLTHFASLGVIPSASSMSRGTYGHEYGRGLPRLRAVETAEKTAGVELIPHTDARSPVSEAYRAFRTSLLLASASSPKVIVITSSFAREGKTTTSVNLATVLAQMGKPVLLIDADLRRPRLQKVFTGKMNLGLVNYLAANIPFDDIIQPTEVPNLSVVLSGPIPPNPSELLASDRMKHIIEEVRSKFAYVIFDSPPVLAVTDAIVLAASADGVVLCVHGGQTPRELVQRSAEKLRQANIPVLGAILNNLDLHQYGYTYRKSYYDYYESNDDEGRESERPRKSS
jgi:succinoglycan biosynthesis transport protein ExoP